MKIFHTVLDSFSRWVGHEMRSWMPLCVFLLLMLQCTVYAEVVTSGLPSLSIGPLVPEDANMLDEAPSGHNSFNLTIIRETDGVSTPGLTINYYEACAGYAGNTNRISYNLTDSFADANDLEATLQINAVNNQLDDGEDCIRLKIENSQAFANAVFIDVYVTDDDDPELTLSFFDQNPSEGVGSITATISRNTDTTDPRTVFLDFLTQQEYDNHNNDVSISTLWPAQTDIPAGASSVGITIDIVDDGFHEGNEQIWFRSYAASGAGLITLTDAEGSFTIEDNDVDDAPEANNDVYEIDEDEYLSVIESEGVLVNDIIGDNGGALEATLKNDVTNGTLSLAVDGSFTYSPNSNFNGTDKFTYSIADEDGDTAEAEVTITVESVYDAPGFDGETSFSVNEGLDFETTITASDVDTSSSNLTFSKTGGKDMDAFGFDAGTKILTLSAKDFETPTDSEPDPNEDPDGVYEVELTVVDEGGLTDVQTFTFTINDFNEVPGTISIDPSPQVVYWNASAGTVIGTVSVFDPDNENGVGSQTHTFEITEDASGKFQVATDVNGVTTLKVGDTNLDDPNAESYSIKLRATDNGSPELSSTEQTFVIDVVNGAPVFLDGEYDYPEHETYPIQLVAPDPEGESVTFALVEVDDHAKFDLTSGGLLSFIDQPDYENLGNLDPANTYEITITVQDSKHSVNADFEIEVIDVNEAPGAISVNGSLIVDENAGSGVTIGTFDVSDPDNADGENLQDHSFEVVGSHTDLFEFVDNELKTKTAVPSPALPSYSIYVQATDDHTEPLSSTLQPFTIDVNFYPTWDETSYFYPEHGTGTLQLVASDSNDDPVSFVEVGGADESELSVSIDGEVTFSSTPDYENPEDVAPFNSYEVSVTLSDGRLTTTAQTITINVTPVNENPTGISLEPWDSMELEPNVGENVEAGTEVGTFVTADPDNEGSNPAGQTHKYTLTDDQNLPFGIDGTKLVTDGVIDYESLGTENSYVIVVTSETVDGEGASIGEEPVEVQFTIVVNDVPEPPSVAYNGVFSFDEDTILAAIDEISVSDPEDSPGELIVEGISDDQGIVKDENITFEGTGGTRTVRIEPETNANGSVDVTFRVTDSDELVTEASYEFMIAAVNDPPTANPQSVSVYEDQSEPESITLTGNDIENDALYFTIVDGPTHGTLGGTESNRTYAPHKNYHGSDSFTFKVDDTEFLSEPATVTITVISINDAPTLEPIDPVTVEEGGSDIVVPLTVDDVETSTEELTVTPTLDLLATTIVPVPTVVASFEGGSWQLTVLRDGDAFGVATINVTVTDDDSTNPQSVAQQFVLTVTSVNDTPTLDLIGDVSVAEDSTNIEVGLTAEDVETSIDLLTVEPSIVSTTMSSAPTVMSSFELEAWKLTINPEGDDYGTATIKVTVTDNDSTNPKLVAQQFELTVTPVNDPPTIEPIQDQSFVGNARLIGIGMVAVDDPDMLMDSLSFSALSSVPALVADASISVSGLGTHRDLRIDSMPGAYGDSDITLTVTDGEYSASTSFTYTVLETGTPPADTDGDGIPDPDEDKNGNGVFDPPDPSNWKEKDTDLDGVPDDVELANGTDPADDDSDDDGVLDGVEWGNSPPTLVDDFYAVSQGEVIVLNVLQNDSTLPDAAETLQIAFASSPSEGGQIGISPSGDSISYTAPVGFVGDETFVYAANDGRGAEAGATVTISVDVANHPPEMTSVANILMPANVSFTPYFTTVSDLDDPVTALTLSEVVDDGTLFPEGAVELAGIDAVRTISLMPALGGFGTAQMTLTLSDGIDQVDQVVSVQVGPHGLPPADTDGDGLPDYLEDDSGNGQYLAADDLSHWDNPDTDGDLISDYEEILQGTDPEVPDNGDLPLAGFILFNEFE